jgi:hypothetical protein
MRGMRLERVTRAGAVAGVAFLVLAGLTTQVKAIRAVLAFGDDPYDAVTSFAVIAIAIVGGATVLRWLAQMRREPDAAVERRIAIGAAIVSVIAGVGVASDIVALAVVGVPAVDGAVLLTGALIVATLVAVAVALACVWAARTELLHGAGLTDDEPDLIDDLEIIAGSLGATGISTSLSRWVDSSRFSPRRHRLLAGVLAAGLAGIGAIVWHAFREGAWASPVAAAVFGGLMALGVIGAYLVGLEPLRLIRASGG